MIILISIVEYSKEKKELWDAFVENSRTDIFMFKRDYMEYHSDRFVDGSLLFYVDDNLMGLFPANRDKDTLISHGGLTYGGIVTGENSKQHYVLTFFEELIKYARKNEIRQIVYKPVPHIFHLKTAEEDRYALFVYGAEVLEVSPSTVIDLSRPIKMAKGRKAQISRATREGVSVIETENLESYERVIELENVILMGKHGVRAVHTADELYMLHNRFPENIKLFVASYKGEIIAGVVIYIYKQVVHTQYIASNETAREIGGVDAIIGQIINKYREQKRWIDFGISSENGGKYLNEGLISQKEGFGGRTVVYEKYILRI